MVHQPCRRLMASAAGCLAVASIRWMARAAVLPPGGTSGVFAGALATTARRPEAGHEADDKVPPLTDPRLATTRPGRPLAARPASPAVRRRAPSSGVRWPA